MTAQPDPRPGTPRQLGASTLGAPSAPLEDVLSLLTAHGVPWLELRTVVDEAAGPVHAGLDAGARASVRRLLEARGVRLLALASGVRVADPEPGDAGVAGALGEQVQLAADLGARFVRVFPGAPQEPRAAGQLPRPLEDAAVSDERAVRRLLAAVPLARELGVGVVLETHDSHPRGSDVARVLRQLDARRPGNGCGVVWDVLHPWRVGEDPHQTWTALRPWLAAGRGYVQLKDVASRADPVPVLTGTGAVPLEAVLALLDEGYPGPLSLEWERRWYPQVPPLGEALAATVRAVRAVEARHR